MPHVCHKFCRIADLLLTCSCGGDSQHPDGHFSKVLHCRVLQTVVSPKAHGISHQGWVLKDIIWNVMLSDMPSAARVLHLRRLC